METLVELKPFVVYPEASVYRLLAEPRELDGVRVRTYGVVEFIPDTEGALLFASRHDAQEGLPLSRLQLEFSAALKSRDWFQRFSKHKGRFSGWVVGVFRVGTEPNYIVRLEDVTELDVKADGT